jgi:hypothetical protein
MLTANTSETSVNIYQATRRYNPEDSHLHTRSPKNLKFCLNQVYVLLEGRRSDCRNVIYVPRWFRGDFERNYGGVWQYGVQRRASCIKFLRKALLAIERKHSLGRGVGVLFCRKGDC